MERWPPLGDIMLHPGDLPPPNDYYFTVMDVQTFERIFGPIGKFGGSYNG